MDTSITAYIVHRVPGRLRLRIPVRRGDAVFFARLSEALRQCTGVLTVTHNAATGSLVLITLETVTVEAVVLFARERLALDIQYPVARRQASVVDSIGMGLSGLDRGLASFSAGVLDLRSLLFLLLVVLIVRQVRRGNLAGPVSSLVLSALDITGLARR